ncbi:MAG: class II aldolase/adducin family protein [Candidatus Omnitrophota bacterium]
MDDIKQNIIRIGSLLWGKNLVCGRSGNISAKDNDSVFITTHDSSLGELFDNDIAKINLSGELLDGKKNPTSELSLHLGIYKNIDTNCVVHSHSPKVVAYFSVNDKITPLTFETKLYVGDVPVIEQLTPTVSDINPVIEALKKSNIVVLKNHGVVAIGKTLKDAFYLIQILDEMVEMDIIKKLYSNQGQAKETVQKNISTKRYELFSKEQIDEIVRLVNTDDKFQSEGKRTNLTLNLAVKLDEDNKVYSFEFREGKIINVGDDEKVEFLISGPKSYWKMIFNRELDPFVATTQKKLKLQGDFAKISRWYAQFARLFELWQNVPVE